MGYPNGRRERCDGRSSSGSRAVRPRPWLLACVFANGVLLAATAGLPVHVAAAAPAEETSLGVGDALPRQRAAIEDARRAYVDALAPKRFVAAEEAIATAERDRQRGRDDARVLQQIELSRVHLAEARTLAERVQAALPSLDKARRDAINVRAPTLANAAWTRAETRFLEATTRAERGDLDAARTRAADAEAAMRVAEFEAIAATVLGPARQAIAAADASQVTRLAPRTMADARRLFEQATQELARNRYDTAVPNDLAGKAAYQAKHAAGLAQIIGPVLSSSRDDAELERLLLEREAPIERLAAELGVAPRFDEGYLRPLNDMLERVRALNGELAPLRAARTELERKVAELQGKLDATEAELASVRERQVEPIAPLATSAPNRPGSPAAPAQPATSAAGFSTAELTIERNGTDEIFALHGLRFAARDAVLDAGALRFLERVRELLVARGPASFMVEARVEASGNEDADLTLAQDRANAVRQALVAISGIGQERVTSMGYGAVAAGARVDIVVRSAVRTP